MTFPELLEAQWSDYSARHRNQTNLMIHIVAVPLVWLAAIQVFSGLILTLIGVGGLKVIFWALVQAGLAVFAQSWGNGMEAVKPAPFAATKEYAMGLAAEQFVTFPRFVLTGEWLKNLQGAG